MLLETAMGDSYGIGFEFVKPFITARDHDFSQYRASKFDPLKAGDYSDDTQMALAVSELMINEPGEWDRLTAARYFLQTFKRDPINGYAMGFYNILMDSQTVEEFVDTLDDGSTRNGSAMRSVPLGYIRDIDELMLKAEIQSSVTHNTVEAIMASQAVALAANYFIYNLGTKDGLYDYICQKLNHSFDKNKQDRCQCDAIETIDAVLTALDSYDSMYDIIDYTVRIGGDTDTVAAIACGIASLSDDYNQKLPKFFYDDLRNDSYGRDYLIEIDNKLKLKYLIGS